MKKETKFWLSVGIVLTLSVGSQLLGQDVYDAPEEVDKAISKQEQRENRTAGVVNTLQDWDFRKYEAAHARAHAKMSENPQKYKREQMSRRKKSGQWIKNIVIGGVIWYVGYEMGKDEMKKGWGQKKQNKKDDWKRK
tara:strand:+ start:312 stop:722 length:411 start_codon:yes stop_codon:yes gene_type:complete